MSLPYAHNDHQRNTRAESQQTKQKLRKMKNEGGRKKLIYICVYTYI